MNWTSFSARAAAWVAASIYATHLVRGPTASLGELLGGLAWTLVFTCIPGALLLWLVRTWLGSIAASAGLAAGSIGLVAYISAASEHSSTAGINILGLPFVTAFPVLLVFAIEQTTMPKPRPPLPPPPAPPQNR